MAPVGVYDQMKKVIQDLVAPELHALRGDMRVLDQRLLAVDQKLTQKLEAVDQKLTQKIDAVEANLTTRIDSLRTETVSLKGEVLAEIRRLDTRIDGVDRELRIAIDIRERLAALEARHAS